MEQMQFIPNAGRMPVLELAPTLIQQSLTKLEKLPCVAGVISGKQQGQQTFILVDCKGTASTHENSRAVLGCFNLPGLTVKRMTYDNHHVKITVSYSKHILN